MKKGINLLLASALTFAALGCGQSTDTKDAGAEVIKASDPGGAQPNPNLPQPMAGGGPGTGGGGNAERPAGGKFGKAGG